MANTNLLVQDITISQEAIVFSGIDTDALILNEDLFADFTEEPVVKYSFDRSNQGHMKYLTKLVFNSRVCKSATSLGAKIEKLKDNYVLFNDNFKVTE